MSWLHDVVARAFGRADRMERETARRLARARAFMADNDPNEVRLELEGVEGEEAVTLRAEALAKLVLINLDEARFQAASGDRSEAASALARAKAFGATPEQLAAHRGNRPPSARRTNRDGGSSPPA